MTPKLQGRKKGKKIALLFPGQGPGSVQVGMGLDIFLRSEAARKIFWKVDSYLGWPLSHLCFFGPRAELLKTENAQPASLTVSLAYVEAQKQLGKEGAFPDYLAGLSLGYITALVVAGVINIYRAIDIVKVRAPAMAEAARKNPGSMIILYRPKIAEVRELRQRLGLGGNDNSENQMVLSGPIEIMEKAKEEVHRDGLAARTSPLETEEDLAFHSKCMKPAEAPLAKVLAKIPFADPKISIIGNSRAQVITTGEEAKKEVIDHLCSVALWDQSTKLMRKLGVTRFIEAGYGEVLSNNLKRGLGLRDKLVKVRSLSSAIRRHLPRVRGRRKKKATT